jgi:hypothetical protein
MKAKGQSGQVAGSFKANQDQTLLLCHFVAMSLIFPFTPYPLPFGLWPLGQGKIKLKLT